MRKSHLISILFIIFSTVTVFAAEIINGTDHADTLYGTDGDDEIHGLAGSDYLYGESGDDILYGDAGNDVLRGGAGNDVLLGGEGNDDLDGGEGDDYLDGGPGRDYYRGGPGNDVMRVDKYDYIIDGGGDGIDVITFATMEDYFGVQGNVDAVEIKILDPDGEIKSYADVEKIGYESLAYERFNKACVEQIKETPENGEVLVDTLTWISFHRMVYEALEERRDITFKIRYYYEGHLFTVTIPPDADVSDLGTQTGYDGFLYLSTMFETVVDG